MRNFFDEKKLSSIQIANQALNRPTDLLFEAYRGL